MPAGQHNNDSLEHAT